MPLQLSSVRCTSQSQVCGRPAVWHAPQVSELRDVAMNFIVNNHRGDRKAPSHSSYGSLGGFITGGDALSSLDGPQSKRSPSEPPDGPAPRARGRRGSLVKAGSTRVKGAPPQRKLKRPMHLFGPSKATENLVNVSTNRSGALRVGTDAVRYVLMQIPDGWFDKVVHEATVRQALTAKFRRRGSVSRSMDSLRGNFPRRRSLLATQDPSGDRRRSVTSTTSTSSRLADLVKKNATSLRAVEQQGRSRHQTFTNPNYTYTPIMSADVRRGALSSCSSHSHSWLVVADTAFSLCSCSR